MFRVNKRFGHELGYSCAFRQWRAESHCRFIHGYALAFTLAIECTELDERHWAFDFGGFKRIRQFLEDTFDHKYLMAYDDPMGAALADLEHKHQAADIVELPHVGCEAFAEYVFTFAAEVITRDTGGRAALVAVTVEEHGANSITYTPCPTLLIPPPSPKTILTGRRPT